MRTFAIGEDRESDKKLFMKVEGTLESLEDFEQRSIDYFIMHGKVRERPKVENISGQKYKMTITYTNPKSAANAMEDFPTSDFVKEYQKKGITITLNNFHSK
jgi:DUF1009 family protein